MTTLQIIKLILMLAFLAHYVYRMRQLNRIMNLTASNQIKTTELLNRLVDTQKWFTVKVTEFQERLTDLESLFKKKQTGTYDLGKYFWKVNPSVNSQIVLSECSKCGDTHFMESMRQHELLCWYDNPAENIGDIKGVIGKLNIPDEAPENATEAFKDLKKTFDELCKPAIKGLGDALVFGSSSNDSDDFKKLYWMRTMPGIIDKQKYTCSKCGFQIEFNMYCKEHEDTCWKEETINNPQKPSSNE